MQYLFWMVLGLHQILFKVALIIFFKSDFFCISKIVNIKFIYFIKKIIILIKFIKHIIFELSS